ncbi:MAG: YihY/virulence factor BrkB family protein [Candidatus Zixiibacteriota bacterium]|nr:MAG: YihY/virulence factor BrkB family protein [candidate division Zixibacteria bacterium]
MKKIWALLKAVIDEFGKDKATVWAAALAYYTIFSLAPLLLIAISVAGLIFGPQAARGQVMDQVSQVIGPQAAQGVQSLLAGVSRPGTGLLAAGIGFVVLLWGASSLSLSLKKSLHFMWDITPPGGGILGMLKSRFTSVWLVLGIGFVLLISMAVSATVAGTGRDIGQAIGVPPILLNVVDWVLSLVIFTLAFGLIFRYLPDTRVQWRDVLIGAGITAVLFTIGKVALGYYLGRSAVASGYGAAGSLVVLLLWIYYSAQILFLGAEFTQVYSQRFGSGIRPEKGARRLEEGEKRPRDEEDRERQDGARPRRRPHLAEEEKE